MADGVPADATARKTTGCSVPTLAVIVWTPIVGPRVHVRFASPETSVRAAGVPAVPLPAAGAKFTTMPVRTVPALFLTRTVACVVVLPPAGPRRVSVDTATTDAGVTSGFGGSSLVEPPQAESATTAVRKS